jgi:predicted secreted protein
MAIVQVRDADAVAVKVGDVLEWHLTENPSTGYERAISVDGGLEIELDKTEPAAVAMPGAAGQRVFSGARDKAGRLERASATRPQVGEHCA